MKLRWWTAGVARLFRGLSAPYLVCGLLLAGSSVALAGAPKPFDNPDKVALDLTTMLAKGENERAASEIQDLVGLEGQQASLASTLGYVRGKTYTLTDKVIDRSFGTALRQIVYLIHFKEVDFLYVRFNFKRTGTGWILANFNFRTEVQEMFPNDFVTSY